MVAITTRPVPKVWPGSDSWYTCLLSYWSLDDERGEVRTLLSGPHLLQEDGKELRLDDTVTVDRHGQDGPVSSSPVDQDGGQRKGLPTGWSPTDRSHQRL